MKFAIFLKSTLLFNSFYCLFCLQAKLYGTINSSLEHPWIPKILVFVIWDGTIIYLLLCNVYYCTFGINSLASKFDEFEMVVIEIFDILIITEKKLDNTFPTSQFYIEGFSMPYRLDKNRNGGWIFIYVRESIPTKILIKHNLPEDIERIFLEINFQKSQWLLCWIYHPLSRNDQ